MFSNANFTILWIIHQRKQEIRIQRRYLRDHNNILELPETQFVSYFRVSKEMFKIIYEDMLPHFPIYYRGTSISPQLKIATFLRFLGSGSYQNCVGNDFLTCMSQSEISNTIKECLNIFEKYFCPKWIRFSKTADEETTIKRHFYEKFGFSGIIGVVDGTHVRIKSPKQEEKHLYYNRKCYYSLNVMLICDHNMVINFVDARYPGSNHDSLIWKMSAADHYLKRNFSAGKVNTWVIGLLYTPQKATQIVNVCCAIHNACIFYKNDWTLSDEIPNNNDNIVIEEEDEISTSASAEIRRRIAESLS